MQADRLSATLQGIRRFAALGLLKRKVLPLSIKLALAPMVTHHWEKKVPIFTIGIIVRRRRRNIKPVGNGYEGCRNYLGSMLNRASASALPKLRNSLRKVVRR